MSAWPRPEPPPAAPSADHRASAMQALHLMVGGMILFLLGGGALAAASVSHHHKSTVRGAANAAPAGPDRATALERYIADRSAELGSAKGRLTAVVSFRAYATEEQAKRAVGNANIVRWLVAAPGGEPDVTDDVKRWRQGVVRSAQDEIAEFEKLIPTLSQDPDFERQSRQDMETDRKLVAAVQGGTPLVFGVVVDADAALLRTIGTRAEVRLVDLAPSAKSANTDIHGLRPEEVVAAGDPSERPAL